MPIRTIAIPAGAWIQPPSRVGPPAYDSADLNVVQGLNFDGVRGEFDGSANEYLMASFTVPDNFVAGGIREIVISWLSNTAIVGDVRWAITHRSVGDTEVWDDTFGIFSVDDDTVSGVLGTLSKATIDLTLAAAWDPGEVVQLVLLRAGAHAADTMIGDASMVMAHVLIQVEEQDLVVVASSETNDGASPLLSVGQFVFNPLEWPTGSVFQFGTVMSVTNAGETGAVSLYNLTDGELVTGGSHTSSSLSFLKIESTPLTVGSGAGELKDSEKIYEVQLAITGGAPTDSVVMGTAYMRIV